MIFNQYCEYKNRTSWGILSFVVKVKYWLNNKADATAVTKVIEKYKSESIKNNKSLHLKFLPVKRQEQHGKKSSLEFLPVNTRTEKN